MLERAFVRGRRCALPLLLSLLVVGCQRGSTPQGEGSPIATSDSAEDGNSSGAGVEQKRSDGTTLTAAEKAGATAPGLGSPRLLAGTGITLALPAGMRRASRELVFRTPDADALTLSLAVQHSSATLEETAERSVMVFGATKSFEVQGEPQTLTETPKRMVLRGKLTRALTGDSTSGQPGLVAMRQQGERLLVMKAGFAEGLESTAQAVAESLDVSASDALDPLAAYGLTLDVAPGFQLLTEQLHPIVAVPKGTQAKSDESPSLDIRVTAPGKLEQFWSELFRLHKVDESTTECQQSADSRRVCRFQSGFTNAGTLVTAVDDPMGAVVAVASSPASADPAQVAALERMSESLQVRAVPQL